MKNSERDRSARNCGAVGFCQIISVMHKQHPQAIHKVACSLANFFRLWCLFVAVIVFCTVCAQISSPIHPLEKSTGDGGCGTPKDWLFGTFYSAIV